MTRNLQIWPTPAKIWRTGLIVLLLFISANAVSAQPVPRDKSTSDTKQKKSAEALIEGTEIVIKVSVVKDNVVSTNEFDTPDEGNKFVSVQIVLDNSQGKDDWEVKPDSFRLKDAEGNVYEPEGSILSTPKISQPTLKSGIVDSGDFVRGWITFQIGSSVSVKSLKLRYEYVGLLSETPIKSGWIDLSAVVK